MSPRTARRASTRLALTLALAALPATSCGEDGGSAEQSPQGAQLDQAITLADCSDWTQGSVDERLGTIRELREFHGGPVPGAGGTGAVLEDEQAYELFEGHCVNDSARGYKLYKLYARAAAFSNIDPTP